MAILNGKAYWAAITVPNTKYEPVYSIDLALSDEDADMLEAEGYNVKTKDYGRTIAIKRKVRNAKGEERPKPKLMDAAKNPFNEQVGNGSEVRVQYRPWEMPRQGTVIKGLDLQAVQVLKLETFAGADGSEFDDEFSPNTDEEGVL
jgi:hypothetical protein